MAILWQFLVAGLTVPLDDLGGCAGDGAVRRNIAHKNETVGPDFDIIADRNRPQKSCTRPDQNVITQSGVALPLMLACASEGDVVE